jgi:hypothetical protein
VCSGFAELSLTLPSKKAGYLDHVPIAILEATR